MKKILIIEDDMVLIKILQARLSKEYGVDFLLATQADEGLRKVQEELPDLVLLDLLFPADSGERILKEIKGNANTKDIPVIVMSVAGGEDRIERIKKLGAADYIVKGHTSLNESIERIKMVLHGDTP